MASRIHPTAEVSPDAKVGDGTLIWHHAQVREKASIGTGCVISKGAYIDTGVIIGDRCKIQNYVSVYHGVELEDGVFVGPHVCFTNDKNPRAVNPDGSQKSVSDWRVAETRIRRGASLGANSTIVCGVTVGEWALVGAGSVVTKDVPAHGVVWGNPARLRGHACVCGAVVKQEGLGAPGERTHTCSACGKRYPIPVATK
ncbi:N-acetyltransferase [Candidatus Woesearchaeota archaeon]|nr:N-acetyltransferase [Candidatus Woesearchaeota archaeon]